MHNNPYVGPRPYERADCHNFFGRGREARDLLALMLAERVLLFYAQSGAGKTSLLNAQVIPALEDKGFDVLPVARVGSDLPPGIDPAAVSNVFVFSALMGLAGADVAPETLLEHTLLSFLKTRCTDKPPLLILDQFEELFTTHHDRWQEARDFFAQVRQALEGIPNLGVTLAMREDHIAELDPYAPLLPGRLRARFRMERLGPQAAVEAVAKPAAKAGCPFDPGVAERLVDDLRRIKTQEAGGRGQEAEGGGKERWGTSTSPLWGGLRGGTLGPYVEPVQLQVVCNRLWERLPDQHDNAIQWAEVEQYGNIDRALVDFYENALTLAKVSEPSQGLVVTERQLRRWFSEELITPMETRGLVMRALEDTAGLPNAAVDALEAQHIIRADMRAGARWYELSHDRMVEPIVQSNRGWEQEQENLHPWRPVARQWEKAPSETLLYRGKELAAAQAWLETAAPGEVEGYERAFIEASGEAERGRVRRRRIFTGVSILGVMIVLAMTALTLWAFNSQKEAQKQTRFARASQLAAQAQTVLDEYPQLSLLLAVEAISATQREDKVWIAAEMALREAVQATGGLVLRGHEECVWSLAFSPDGHWLATGSVDGTVRLWSMTTPQGMPMILEGYEDGVGMLAFSPDGHWLATGSAEGPVRLWNIANPQTEPVVLSGHKNLVWMLTFSPDGQWLATGSTAGDVRLWNLTAQQITPIVLSESESEISRPLAFSPDGQWLAIGDTDGTAQVWSIVDPQAPPVVLHGHEGAAFSLAFSHDGHWLAGAVDNTVYLWNMAEPQVAPVALHKCEGSIGVLAFSPDGHWVAGAVDNTVHLLSVADPHAAPVVLRGHEGPVYSLKFSPDGRWLATGNGMNKDFGGEKGDNVARLWDMANLQAAPVILRGHEEEVFALAFSPDGHWLATGSFDSTARLWDTTVLQTGLTILGGQEEDESFALTFSPDGRWLVKWEGGITHPLSGFSGSAARLWNMADLQTTVTLSELEDEVYSLAFSPDGRWLATGNGDDTVHLRNLNDPQATPVVLRGDEGNVMTIAFSPDGRWLATGNDNNTVRLWNMADPQATPVVLQGYEDEVYGLAFSPDGQWLVTVSDETSQLWNLADLQAMPVILSDLYQDSVFAFSPDGRWLAAHGGYSDEPVQLLSLVDLQTAPVTLRDSENGACGAFSLDGSWLAVGMHDGTVRLWRTEEPRAMPIVLRGHGDIVYALAFSPDGRWLATGTIDDGAARLWRVDDLQAEPVLLPGHEWGVLSLVFSPDGHWLATTDIDGTVRLWNMRLEELIDLACRTAGRNLRWTEWEQYMYGKSYKKTCENFPIHPSFIEAGRDLARQGDAEGAIAHFRTALELEPTLELDPEIEAHTLAAPSLIEQGEELARAGEIEAALAAYAQAQIYDPDVAIDADDWNSLCWYGSLYGHAAEVLFACEKAVELEPDDGYIRDSRGLARALTGDVAGAIEDFKFYIEQVNDSEREAWIADLEAGRNPLTPEVLAVLRGE